MGLLEKIRKPVKSRKLIIGAASTTQEGWISSDLIASRSRLGSLRNLHFRAPKRLNIDITRRQDWLRYFRPASLENILSEHVLEHLNPDQMQIALGLAYDFLAPNGRFRIAVPDGNRPDQEYLRQVAPPADGHLQLLTLKTLTAALHKIGFIVTPYEYYDEEGRFHRAPYDEKEGIVLRCYARDRQLDFAYADHFYTSLIVDAVKPGSPA